ncbi:MAG: hypothetical protein KY475_18795 [Planctomycetes bacterium]|nr:hypothetical protein [Planctomycetota bacterium]
MKFTVSTEGRNLLNLRELCEQHVNELWVPAHLTAEQSAEFALDHFKKTVLAELELLVVRAEE